eukprot:986422-Amorphochlora_amoeboformis.AAC.2
MKLRVVEEVASVWLVGMVRSGQIVLERGRSLPRGNNELAWAIGRGEDCELLVESGRLQNIGIAVSGEREKEIPEK